MKLCSDFFFFGGDNCRFSRMLLKCLTSTGTFCVKERCYSHSADVERETQSSCSAWGPGWKQAGKSRATTGGEREELKPKQSYPSRGVCWWAGKKQGYGLPGNRLPSSPQERCLVGFPKAGGAHSLPVALTEPKTSEDLISLLGIYSSGYKRLLNVSEMCLIHWFWLL